MDDGPRWVVFPNTPCRWPTSATNKFKDFAGYTRERTTGTEKLPSTASNPGDRGLGPEGVDAGDRVQRRGPAGQAHGQATHQRHHAALRPGRVVHAHARPLLPAQGVQAGLHPHVPDQPPGPGRDGRQARPGEAGAADPLLDPGRLAGRGGQGPGRPADGLAGGEGPVRPAEGRGQRLRAEKLMAEIERARDAGRHQWAIKALAAFPKETCRERCRSKVTGLGPSTRLGPPSSTPHADCSGRIAQAGQGGRQQFLAEAAAAVRTKSTWTRCPGSTCS